MNKYQKELCAAAHKALHTAEKAMIDASQYLFMVDGAEFEHDIYVAVLDQIGALSQAYYAKSQEGSE